MTVFDISEREFQAMVIEFASLSQWLVYHTHDSRRSHAGFPDLTLVRPPRVVFAELKSERGRVMPQQQAWLDNLRECAGVESYLWRPSDWDELEDVLR